MGKDPLRILIVGAGMYVTGRGTNTKGTIVPALLEGRRRGIVGDIAICGTSQKSAADGISIIAKLGIKMNVDGNAKYYPEQGYDELAYLKALELFKPDAVIVSTPDATHEAIAVAALEYGAHCLVVKPLAPTIAECRRMIKAADRAGVVAQVEFHKRLDESNMLLRDAIRTDKIGQPLYAVVEYSQRKVVPEKLFRKWIDQTNIMNYLGVHYIDVLLFATGYKPLYAIAWGQKGYLHDQALNTYDAIQAAISWDTGIPGASPFLSMINTSWVDANSSAAMSQQSINLTGTKGRVQADQTRRGLRITSDAQGVQDINPYFTSAYESEDGRLVFTGYGIESVLRFVTDTLAVRSGQVSPKQLDSIRPSFRQAFISTAVIEAIDASLRDNSTKKDITSWL